MMHPLRRLPRGQLYFDPAQVAMRTAQFVGRPLQAGAAVAQLEREICELLGCGHAVALAHARVALWLSLSCLNLPKGAEVLTTPVTVPEVIAAIELAGLRPRFVDLDVHTAQVDIEALAAAVGPQTRIILITHLCGMLANMDAVGAIARQHSLLVMEDASQAMGARWRGRAAGTMGTAGIFSISTLKPVSSFHGGLLVTDDGDLAARVRALAEAFPLRSRRSVAAWLARDYAMYFAAQPELFAAIGWPLLGQLERHAPAAVRAFQRGRLWPSADPPGACQRLKQAPAHWRLRFSDYQACLALDALTRFNEQADRRRRLSRTLLAELHARGVAGLPRLEPGAEALFWRLPVWTEDLQHTRQSLARRGIDSTTTNLSCCSRASGSGHLSAPMPNAEAFVDHALFLPLHPDLRASDMVHMAMAMGDAQVGA